MPNELFKEYEYSISRNEDGTTKESGSLTYWSDDPVSDYAIGDTFSPIPNVELTANKISIDDSVLFIKDGEPYRQWKVTVDSEGSGSSSGGSDGENTRDKFTFEITKDNDGDITKTGTWQITRVGAAPTVSIQVGDTFTVPGIGDITCTKVSASDSYSGGVRQWTVTVEGSSSVSGLSGSHDRYTFEVDGDTTTATRETTCTGDAPTITTQRGETFNVPYIGAVTCTKINASDTFNDAGVRVWTVTYEGTLGAVASGDLPEDKEEISYEINGITVRTVTGELLALRRSSTPVTRKTLTKYTDTADMLTTIGTTYEGGIAISEKVSREAVKKSGVVVSSYYIHEIEVES